MQPSWDAHQMAHLMAAPGAHGVCYPGAAICYPDNGGGASSSAPPGYEQYFYSHPNHFAYYNMSQQMPATTAKMPPSNPYPNYPQIFNGMPSIPNAATSPSIGLAGVPIPGWPTPGQFVGVMHPQATSAQRQSYFAQASQYPAYPPSYLGQS